MHNYFRQNDDKLSINWMILSTDCFVVVVVDVNSCESECMTFNFRLVIFYEFEIELFIYGIGSIL